MRVKSFLRYAVLATPIAALVALAVPFNLALAEPAPPPTKAEQKRLELYMKPNSYFEKNLKNEPEVVDGHKLHPKIQHYQEQRGRKPEAENAMNDWWDQFLVPEKRYEARRAVDRTWTYRAKITEPMAKVDDRNIPGPAGDMEVRIYTPKTNDRGLLPVLVYIHGGGWIMGSIEAADRAVRLLANEADVIVVSVNYRMAPEHKFPAAQEDTQAAFRWAVENARSFGGDPSRVGVGGDSAGGQMALVTSLRQWESGGVVPACMMLYYPSVDMRIAQYSSFERFAYGYGLNMDLSNRVRTLIFEKEEDRSHRYSSPMQAPSLKALPPAIIATSNFDIIRDQVRALADRMKADGIQVIYKNYSSLTHGFLQHTKTTDDALAAAVKTARLYGELIRGRYLGDFHG